MLSNHTVGSKKINLYVHVCRYGESKLMKNNADEKAWLNYVAVALVNAFYSQSRNSIMFPAGFLQGAFFNPKVPKYLNYGSLGSVMGHELTHGFDDEVICITRVSLKSL